MHKSIDEQSKIGHIGVINTLWCREMWSEKGDRWRRERRRREQTLRRWRNLAWGNQDPVVNSSLGEYECSVPRLRLAAGVPSWRLHLGSHLLRRDRCRAPRWQTASVRCDSSPAMPPNWQCSQGGTDETCSFPFVRASGGVLCNPPWGMNNAPLHLASGYP
jgi:hypothetical protein